MVSQWKTNISHLIAHKTKLCVNIDVNLNQKDMYVLRDNLFLTSLKDSIKRKLTNEEEQELVKKMMIHQNSLVAVNVFSLQTGVPENNAPLYIPFDTDLLELEESKQDFLADKYNGPFEPKHKGLKRLFPYICKSDDVLRHNAQDIGVNTRWLIGYVQKGRYSLARGKGAGFGYVSMVGLIYLLSKADSVGQLLFRNTNTLQYRFCNFDIFTYK